MTRMLTVAAAAALMIVPSLAQAQGATDSRWSAWIGCWVSGPLDASGGSATRPVCIVPAGGSAVDIVAIRDGSEVSRERIEADGSQHQSQRDGCTGWQSARWSGDARRVYLKSEHQCTAAGPRKSSGLIAMTPEGEWLDIVSVTTGEDQAGVRVIRHRPIFDPSGLPAPVAMSLATASRSQMSRVQAGAPIAVTDIVEASHQISDAAVAAWLNDVRQRFDVDAKRLIELADAGVPDRVVDMMVGLAYPNAFSVPPSPTRLGALATDERDGGSVAAFDPGCGFDFSLFGFGGCSPYAYSPFGYSPFAFGYLPYSSRFGYPGGFYPGGYGGWYDTPPVVVVIKPGDGTAHGQVVNGRGYSSGSTGTTAAPPSTTSSSSGSGSSGGGGGSSSGGGGGGGGDGGGRTAQPR